MTGLPHTTDHQCQCVICQASRALEVLDALPDLTDDGRAALEAIGAAIDIMIEDSFAEWDAMNSVATAAGLDWRTATRQDILDAVRAATPAPAAGEEAAP